MDKTRLRMDLNLQDLSLISIAAKLWDSQDIKNQIKNNISRLGLNYREENWCEISKLVVQIANSINLPPRLSALLKKTVLLIGKKIYDWICYVKDILGLDLIFTQKIYFSSGVVDEIKIFDLYWRHLMAGDNFIYQSKYFKHSPLFSLACMYGCERLVKERKNEMLDELSEFYPQMNTGDEIYNITSVSICLTAGKSMLGNVASPVRMFEVCLEAGFSKAARFYWEKLNEVEKFSNLTNWAKTCWRENRMLLKETETASFLKEKYCENLLFLINQMGEEEKSLFFADYADEIIKLFLPIWPYQELIVDVLKYDWNIESSRLLEMAYFLIRFSISLNRLEFPVNDQLLFQIMEKAWGNILVQEKLCFFKEWEFSFSYLFLNLNPKILNLLFNDPSITEIDGKKMNSFVEEGFVGLIKMGKFDFLNAIIESDFNFIPEPKKFLNEKFLDNYFIQDLIKNDKSFGLVDQFLDWSAESEAERARLKNKINTISICRSITEPDYRWADFGLADKFLKWRLETDAEIKRFKDEMKSFNFVILLATRGGYVRIKSGDLSWLRPWDALAFHPDEYPLNNADGLTFLKFEDATELNRGVVLGIKSFVLFVNDDFLGPDFCHAAICGVDYVGTQVGDFIVYRVREIWNDKDEPFGIDFKLHDVVYLSNAFIKFYYETDQEVLEFKKTKLRLLVTENVVEFLLDALRCRRRFPENFLDNFCKFCMIPSEEIEEIKIQQRSDIDKFLDTYVIDKRRFTLADIYLDWLFEKGKKTEVCKKFMNSSNKGALLCVSFMEDCGEASPLGIKCVGICRWLSMVDDREKLKKDVFALSENTPEWFPALLDPSAHQCRQPLSDGLTPLESWVMYGCQDYL